LIYSNEVYEVTDNLKVIKINKEEPWSDSSDDDEEFQWSKKTTKKE